MCGIVGIVIPKGIKPNRDPHASLKLGSISLARRGPDGEGVWHSDRVYLAHRRLAIIDPDPRSNQPIESANWTLCYNGEIYNFKSIKTDLISLGQKFKTSSDTEVLLLALEQWGIAGTLKRIAGMFAFIAYNKANDTTYLVRDHMGIKPLIYSTGSDGSLFAASSVTAIRAMRSDTHFSVEPSAVASYLLLGGTMTDSSCYSGISHLPPATYLEIKSDGSQKAKKYWEPIYQSNYSMDDLISVISEYEMSDVKSAMFLSGGVDSSFLATVFNDLDCFHLVSPEEQYARAVAKRFNRNFVAVAPELSDYEKSVENAINFHGEPLMSVGIPFAVSKAINANGYKMAISANGADELFHGYQRTPMPEYSPSYLPLHEPQNYVFLGQQLAHIFRDNRNFNIPKFSEFLHSIHELGSVAMRTYNLSNFPASASHRWLELMTYVLYDLNPTLDAASMYNSIEVRVPFLDHRVVQGVLSWDASKLVTPTQGRKAPLKERLSKFFPHTLYQRSKLGFSIHSEQLNSISQLSENALASAIDDGFIEIKNGKKFGEYGRDLIYLGSSLYGLNKWAGNASHHIQ